MRAGGVRKRRRGSLSTRAPSISPTVAPVEDATPSLVSVHLGSGVLSELEAEMQSGLGTVNAVVDCTQLAEVSSCATGVSDVTSKSMRESSPQDEVVYKEERWDAPIGDDELSTDFIDGNMVRAVRYGAQDGYQDTGQIDPVAIGADPLQPMLEEILLRDIAITDKEILAPSEMVKSPESPERKVPEFSLSLLEGFLPSII